MTSGFGVDGVFAPSKGAESGPGESVSDDSTSESGELTLGKDADRRLSPPEDIPNDGLHVDRDASIQSRPAP